MGFMAFLDTLRSKYLAYEIFDIISLCLPGDNSNEVIPSQASVLSLGPILQLRNPTTVGPLRCMCSRLASKL